jgi:flagellar hook-basal body complex protein FliE
MIIPAIGGLASELSLGGSHGLAKGTESLTGAEALPQSSTGGSEGVTGGESSSFGSALSGAISSLESTQTSADAASQSLAMGTAKDPESAVVTVEDAQMAMDLASEIRTKATEAAQSIFSTQV